MIEITPALVLDDSELTFQTARSAGPGGQNVNKVETKVTLRFDVAASPSLSEAQRERIAERLATRINKEGVLAVRSQRHRTQGANRAAVTERFVELLREALSERAERRPTRPRRGAKRRRLDEKRRRGEVKQRRGPVDWEG